MASNDISDIFNSFGCFDDSSVPSLFEDLEALGDINPPSEVDLAVGTLSGIASSPDIDMMSIGSSGSGSPHHAPSSPDQDEANTGTDHTYAESIDDSVMIGGISPEHDRSSSPGGSLSSEQEESRDLLLYLMNETGVQVSEKEEDETLSKKSSTSRTRRRKRHQSDDDDDEETTVCKNRKNAIAARENRLKKKRYVQGLEKENKTLTNNNAQLLKDNNEMKGRVSSLEAEVDYLKSVLYNQSALSGLLKKLGPDSNVRLATSFSSKNQQRKTSGSGGVCLHVNGRDASLEFCAQCELMAKGAS